MKEFKVIVGDTAASTHILVDGKQVSYVQDIKVHVGIDVAPVVEIVFPDLRDFHGGAADAIAEQTELLKDLPQVKISLAKIDFPKS